MRIARRGPRLRRRPAAATMLPFGDADVPNFRKDAPPQTMLGAKQKAWFLERLRASTRDLEDLGQLARHARLARRSAEPARRDRRSAGRARATPDSAAAVTGDARTSSAREIYDAVRAARHHRIRHGRRAIATASGPARGEGPAAAAVRAGRRRVRHRLDLGAGHRRGLRAPASRRSIRCARCTSPSRGPASSKRRSTCCCITACARCLEYAAHRRPAAGARGCRTRTWPHTGVRRHGRPRLRGVRVERDAALTTSSASRGRSSAARRRTAARCATRSPTAWRSGARARRRGSSAP